MTEIKATDKSDSKAAFSGRLRAGLASARSFRYRSLIRLAVALAALLPIGVLLAGQGTDRPSLRIVEDNSGRIEQFVMQVAAGELPRLLPTIHDFVSQVGLQAEGYFVCADQQDADRLAVYFQDWGLAQQERFQISLLPELSTIWARDRYIAVRRGSGESTLLVPPFRDQVGGDFWVPQLLSRWIPGLAVLPAVFYLEGGDLVAGHRSLFVGATTVRFAREEVQPCTEAQVRLMLEGQFGKQVVFLPGFGNQDEVADDLDYHLDMFLTVCTDDSVLLADLAWGDRLMGQREGNQAPDGPFDAEELEAIRAEHEIQRRRLEAVHGCLIGEGVPVRRVPLYWIPGADHGMTYNNVLQEETPDGPVVYLPQYGLEELDAAAVRVYVELGYEVRPVDVSQIFELQGTLRCVVNVIRREPVLVEDEENLHVRRGSEKRRYRAAGVAHTVPSLKQLQGSGISKFARKSAVLERLPAQNRTPRSPPRDAPSAT